jgi:hypothetical protein
LTDNPQNELYRKKEPRFQWLQISRQMNGKNIRGLNHGLTDNPQNELYRKKEPRFQWLQISRQMNGKNIQILCMKCETS